MSPFAEVSLVIQRELRKNFRSVKGIVLFILSLLGGVGVTMIMVSLSGYLDRQMMANKGMDPQQLQAMKLGALVELYGEDQGKYLAAVPTVMLIMFNVMVWLAPLLIVLMGFDAISGETQHRTVRYWTVRTRRSSYYVGKILGLWTVNSAVWLVMSIVVWIIAAARGEAAIGECVGWGVRLWLITLPMSGAWVAIATLVASQFRGPMISLLGTLGAFFVIWLLYFSNARLYSSGKVAYRPLAYIYPNFYQEFLLAPHFGRFATGLLPCLGITALLAGLGAWRFQTRDV